ncbi:MULTISPECIES: efflux RND transporter periplasmic adaptor subunit [unclassified Rhodanobacter]|uniref:efflux RND transporter periplasmic adaptor subunit n=1 Tax=unclassified Rhodanobacter TaxID=2621553 RepID=UPI001BDED07C|nr:MULTISPECIES: efflux RND transporter periplasmic adaptor subunit [unclassified Rhodanobacter]MBT2143949.1 efflux RND transporter periplasmic adaptor subunit [Rhodanobacter sp. LX-99]MBT2146977.1 efflux RND transporter periplasmic adaptor subunit [Rhodanobacter sp. LX-100]
MNRSLLLPLLCLLLAACSHGATDDEEAAAVKGQVAVTTATPVQQAFHDTVEAWGSAAGDPQHARAISLAHGGQVVALSVAAGQSVRRGQPLLTIAPDPAARSAYRQAQSALELARGELQRTEQLATQRLATQSQLATARKALADAQAALDAQRALGGGSARETVSAPADGVVNALGVGLGERFAANAPLLSFTPAHALVAQLGVQPEDGARLHVGMPVQLRSVYGDKASFIGSLRMIGQSIDPQTHLLGAQVELPAEAGAALVAGAALDAQIRTADFSAWAVPRAAVLHDEHGDYLFQIEHGHAKRVDVTLRSPEGDPVGVQGPLDAQAKVIVLGAYELADGDAVQESAR